MGNIRLISTDRIRRLNCRPGRNSRIFRSGLRRIHPGNPPHDMFWRRSSSELPTPASCGNRPRKHCRDNVCRLVRKRYKRWKTGSLETAQYRFVVRVGRLLASVGRFGLLLRLVQGIDRRIGRRRIGFLSVSSLFPGFQPGDDRVPVHRSRRVRRGRSVFFVFDEQSGVFYVGVFPDIRRDQAQPAASYCCPSVSTS